MSIQKFHIRLGANGAASVYPRCGKGAKWIGLGLCMSPTEFAKLDPTTQCQHCFKILIRARQKKAV